MLLVNGRVVNEERIFEADLLLRDGRIAAVGSGLSAPAGARVIDLNGKLVLPGMIDDQVHFRDPGLTPKGDLVSESRAAVAGGITSFMDMPNTSPPTVTRAALADKYARATGRVHANFAFYFGATNDNLDEIKALRPGEACGVKVFMGASTGNMLVDDRQALEGIFAHAPILVATHCEDSPTIWAAEAEQRERYGDDIPMALHPVIRSELACYKSSSLAVGLAKQHGTRLHVLHLTTAKELELFAAGPVADKRITAEACVHHLWFDDSDYATLGTRIKCNPAIKTAADREGLLAGVKADVIDVIATDHAPHLLAEKNSPYAQAPAGLPLVQHALLTLLEHHQEGRFSLELIVRKSAHAVAELFGVRDRGFIREGYWADLAIVDLAAPTRVTRDNVLYKCGWSPFEGVAFRSTIAMTFVNGQLAYQDGRISEQPAGQRLIVGGNG
jgi:dihydroorotase